MSSAPPSFSHPLKSLDFSTFHGELRAAIAKCSSRGLFQSARWAAELLTQVPIPADSHPFSQPPEVLSDSFLLARTFFDLREFDRCAHCLREENSQAALFLRCYARFLAGEKRRDEELAAYSAALSEFASGPQAPREAPVKPANEEARQILAEYAAAEKTLDAFNLYLYAILLKEHRQSDAAIDVLIRSLTEFPLNWSGWHTLSLLIQDRNQLSAVASRLGRSGRPCWIQQFFYADCLLELHGHENNEVLDLLDGLGEIFPDSSHILAQTASAHYSKREFDAAQELYETLRQIDPYRLEGLDSYSNILYVKENRSALSFLAHSAFQIEKFSVSTCIIAGNYHSLKGEHEKAIQFFRRALVLDHQYLSAWTLMGHEFIELRNASAAIECYRKAVEINAKDYRAWYGLGQVYEILQMYTFSLFYHKKAAFLRPFDPRMFCAMAECYEKLNKIPQAIRCYQRAEYNGGTEDIEGSLFSCGKLAKLYVKQGENERAAAAYRKFLKLREKQENKQNEATAEESPVSEDLTAVTPDTLEAFQFLAEYCKTQGDYSASERFCTRLCDFGGPAKDFAKSLLNEIRAIQGGNQKNQIRNSGIFQDAMK